MEPFRADAPLPVVGTGYRRMGVALLLASSFVVGSACVRAGEPLALPALPVEATAHMTAVAALPDGGFVVGGTFERINGTPRRHVARFHADGNLDQAWNIGLDFGTTISDIAVDASGNVYIAGLIHIAAGLPRNGLVKVLPTGQVDPAWAPTVGGGGVETMAAAADGWLYLGGSFTSIGGQPRSRLARVSQAGTGGPPDAGWTPAASGLVQTLVIDGGDVLVGGDFTTMSGASRVRLARVSRANGAAVSTTWAPSANARVSALMVGGDGDVVVGGRFTELNGQSTNYLGKVRAADAGLVAAWTPNPTGEVQALAIDGMGWLLAGGSFGFVGQTQQAAAARIRYDGTGEVDTLWRPRLQPGIVVDLARVGATVVLGGSLRHVNETARHGAARLDGSTGEIVTPVDLDQRGTVRGMALASDGSVVITGSFQRVDGHPRNTIAKIRADGLLDLGWDLGLGSTHYANAVAIDAQDRLHVGGYFSLGSGTPVLHLARVSLAGSASVDTSWRPAPSDEVLALAMSPDGSRVYVGGAFSSIGGSARSHIARVTTTGLGAADAWGPTVNGNINLISISTSGNVYLGGPFTTVDGQSRARLVRVAQQGAGALDALWNPQPNERIYKVDERPEGVYVAGWYTAIGGVARRNLVRLQGPTGSADAWAPNPYGGVNAMHFIDGERLLIGGSFLDVAGMPISGLAVISLASPATAEPLQWMGVNDYVLCMLPKGETVWLGGYFNKVGTTSRFSLAAIGEPAGDAIFASGFELMP